jgi:hypothetical protein
MPGASGCSPFLAIYACKSVRVGGETSLKRKAEKNGGVPVKFMSNIMAFIKRSESNVIAIRPNEYLFLCDENGHDMAALIAYSPEMKMDMLSEFKQDASAQYASGYSAVTGAIVDKLGAVGPVMMSGARAGELMQIVAPPEIVKALADGSVKLMQTPTGATSSVVAEGSSRIVGQVRLAPANVAPIVTPVVLYQILNAIAGAHQLSKINARLDSLQRAIDSVIFRQQANSYARLYAAIDALQELDREYCAIGMFTDDMRWRLSIATNDIQAVNYESSFIIGRFKRMSEDLIRSSHKRQGAIQANTMLNEESNVYMLDAAIYVTAVKAGLMAEQMWIRHDLQFVPEYVGYRLADLNCEIEELKETVPPMRYIEELQDHADSCLREMRSLQRWTSPRLSKEIRSRSEQFASMQEDDSRQYTAQSLFIWEDDKGEIKALSGVEAIDTK